AFDNRLHVRQLSGCLRVDAKLAIAQTRPCFRAAQLDEIHFLADVGGPAEFDLQRSAVFETNEASCQILNVERSILLAVAEGTMIGISNGVIGELRVLCTSDGYRLRVAHDPHGEIDKVYAEVNQRSA